MSETDKQRSAEQDAFLAGFEDIPAEKLSGMSFIQLATELSYCKPGSAKYLVVENAMLRHNDSAQKQATRDGAKIGAVATLVGAVVGAVLTAVISSPPQISSLPSQEIRHTCVCEYPAQSEAGNKIKSQSTPPKPAAKVP